MSEREKEVRKREEGKEETPNEVVWQGENCGATMQCAGLNSVVQSIVCFVTCMGEKVYEIKVF